MLVYYADSDAKFPYLPQKKLYNTFISSAFSQEDVSFTIDYLKPYLIHRKDLERVKAQLQKVEKGTGATEVEAKDAVFAFRREGDFYQITYGEREFPPIKAHLGFQFLVELLQGRVWATPLDLEAALKGVSVSLDGEIYGKMSSDQIYEEEGLHFEGKDSRPAKMDETYIKQCKDELKLTLIELEKAIKNTERSQIEILEKKKVYLLDHLKKNMGLFGRSRQWDGPNQKALRRISKAIHRAIKKIEEIEKDREWDLEFSRHLKRSLTPVRFPYRYSPDEHIDWQT